MFFASYYDARQIEEDEMGGAYSTREVRKA
jgi:hypothetical protein